MRSLLFTKEEVLLYTSYVVATKGQRGDIMNAQRRTPAAKKKKKK